MKSLEVVATLKTGGSFWMMINAYIHNKWCLEFPGKSEHHDFQIEATSRIHVHCFHHSSGMVHIPGCLFWVCFFGDFCSVLPWYITMKNHYSREYVWNLFQASQANPRLPWLSSSCPDFSQSDIATMLCQEVYVYKTVLESCRATVPLAANRFRS